MGVKGLWSYVEHHNVQYAYPTKKSRAGCYGINPRHLFIDMNAVLHLAYNPTTPSTVATLRLVAAKVEELLSRVSSRDALVLVYDGVAPIAKLKTQKERRHGLSVHSPRPASPSSTSKARNSNSIRLSPWYTSDPILTDVPLRREEIICGSEFVLACEEYITAYLEGRKAQYEWKKLIVSGCREPGEGEVKIGALLRTLYMTTVADGSYSPDDTVTIVGNDSDLILVAMVAVPYTYYTLVDPFDLSLTSLKEIMEHWSQAVPNPPLPAELLPSYRIDFAFLMLLSGDDHYEGIRGDSVALWRRYRHLRANEGYFRRALISGVHFEVDVEFLRALFARSGSMAAQLSCVPRNKRKTAKVLMRDGGGSSVEGVQLLAGALWSLRSYVHGCCVDYGFLAQQAGPLSMGALRAAAHVRGLSRKIGSGVAVGAANGGSAEDASLREAPASSGPIFTPLEQCIAVLGIRGRFSLALSGAIRAITKDDGHTLTTSTSIRFLRETVANIMAAVDTAQLTEAERQLSRHHHRAEPNEIAGDIGAFMELAAIPRNSAALRVINGKRLSRTEGSGLSNTNSGEQKDHCRDTSLSE